MATIGAVLALAAMAVTADVPQRRTSVEQRPYRSTGPGTNATGIRGFRVELGDDVKTLMLEHGPAGADQVGAVDLSRVLLRPAEIIPVYFIPSETDAIIDEGAFVIRLVPGAAGGPAGLAEALLRGDTSEAVALASASGLPHSWQPFRTALRSAYGVEDLAGSELERFRSSGPALGRLNRINAAAEYLADGDMASARRVLAGFTSASPLPRELRYQQAAVNLACGLETEAMRVLAGLADLTAPEAILAGAIALERRSLTQAAAYADTALRLDFSWSEAHLLRGLIFAASGKKEAASYAFRTAAFLAPSAAQAALFDRLRSALESEAPTAPVVIETPVQPIVRPTAPSSPSHPASSQGARQR